MRGDKSSVPGVFLEAPCRGEPERGLKCSAGESLNACNNFPEEVVEGPVAAVFNDAFDEDVHVGTGGVTWCWLRDFSISPCLEMCQTS